MAEKNSVIKVDITGKVWVDVTVEVDVSEVLEASKADCIDFHDEKHIDIIAEIASETAEAIVEGETNTSINTYYSILNIEDLKINEKLE